MGEKNYLRVYRFNSCELRMHNLSTIESETSDVMGPRLLWHLSNRKNYQPPILYRPYDVDFLSDETLAVVEGFFPYSRINIFDTAAKQQRVIGQGSVIPFGVTVADNNDIVVTDHKTRSVQFYSQDGSLTAQWPSNLFDWPNGICRTGPKQYVIADWGRGEVVMANEEGRVIRRAPTKDKEVNSRSAPEYVTIDQKGRIIITDTFDCNVKVIDPQSGKMLLKYGHDHACIQDNIRDPRGLAITSQNEAMVADWGADRVSLYSADGKIIKHVLDQGQGVLHPWGLCLRNNLLACTEQKLNSKPGLKLYEYQL